jgi:hypothetical protein
MKTIDAAYHVVHDYPGGALALAPRLGKHASSLNNEVNPPTDRAPGAPMPKLGIVDAIKITELTRDARIVAAFNGECGYCAPLPLPHSSTCDGSVRELLDRGAELSGKIASLFCEFQKDIADGEVTPAELEAFESSALTMIAATGELARCMRVKMEDDRRMHIASVTPMKRGA